MYNMKFLCQTLLVLEKFKGSRLEVFQKSNVVYKI